MGSVSCWLGVTPVESRGTHLELWSPVRLKDVKAALENLGLTIQDVLLA